MSKPTPGPWTIDISEPDDAYVHGAERDSGWCTSIAKLSPPWRSPKDDGYQYTKDVFEANARLIAAAPELLEELKVQNRAIIGGGLTIVADSHWHKRIVDLIAKAEGNDGT